MHKVTLRDGTRRYDAWLKWARTLAYLLMGVAGVLAVLSPTIQEQLGLIGAAMSWFLAVGGVLAFLGALTERWVGEFTGLPLLASSFAVFAVITTASSPETPFLAIANGCMLFSVSLGLFARFREVKAVFKVVEHVAEREEEANHNG